MPSNAITRKGKKKKKIPTDNFCHYHYKQYLEIKKRFHESLPFVSV